MLDADVRVVAPDDFVKLIKENLGIILNQNYPNPFTDKTTFSFGLTFTQHVILELLDASGSIVKTLYEGDPDTGTTKVEMFKGGLDAGTYMVRLTTPYQTRIVEIQIY